MRPGKTMWRVILVAAQVLLLCYLTALIAGFSPRQMSGISGIVFVPVFVAWAFLFFGSPFLVRSQGAVAVAGWCIAVSALLFSP
jgi:hypothetical protein